MSDFDSVDYFTDMSLVPDPYPYYDHLRGKCPVQQATPYGVVAVTGHAEALAAYKDSAMSSCVAVAGPFPPLPFTPEGDDISAQIEEHRAAIPMAEHVVTMDAEAHQKTRGLLEQADHPEATERERRLHVAPCRPAARQDRRPRLVRVHGGFRQALALFVIADLLGVPAEDHHEFKQMMGAEPLGEVDGGEGETVAHNPLAWLDDKFTSTSPTGGANRGRMC